MTQATKQCACCGTINYADAQFCGGCGQYFVMPAPQATAPGYAAPVQAVVRPQGSKAKWWLIGIAILVAVCLLISAVFHFVIHPYLEDLQISSSHRDDDDDGDGDTDRGGIRVPDFGVPAGTTTAQSTAAYRTTCTTAVAHSENSSALTWSVPSLYEIAWEIEQKGYYMAYDYEIQDEDLGVTGVVSSAAYDGVRYFDEYGNTYGTLVAEWDYGIETVRVMYLEFDSATSAQNAYRYLIADSFFDAPYQETGDSDSIKAWRLAPTYGTDYGLHMLLSCQDNVLVAFWADWDDYKDAGMAYDNAAYSVMEDLGF